MPAVAFVSRIAPPAGLLLALLMLSPAPPATAGVRPACPPGDRACRAFAGDVRAPLPRPGGPRRTVVFGHREYRLTAWEAERQRRCLALTGWAEARGEGAASMRAVMWVVANRAALAGTTPCAVAVADGQFEPFRAEPATRRPATRARSMKGTAPDPRQETRRLAGVIRAQGRVIAAGGMPSWPAPRTTPDRGALHAARVLAWRLDGTRHPDPTDRATHFYAPAAQKRLGRKRPAWTAGLEEAATIGGHVFYRERRPFTDTELAELPEGTDGGTVRPGSGTPAR